jgi:predicted SnoaL-like aldol condensation-catalyzing enzyme
MKQTTSAENKTLVLEAFDTLFNKRDYVAAERYWSPNYIQHSAHIRPGREGLFSLIKSIPPRSWITSLSIQIVSMRLRSSSRPERAERYR